MSNVPPYGYDFINLYNAHFAPSCVHVKNTALLAYMQKYYLQKAMSVFEWTFPAEWHDIGATNYFLYVLYCLGFISVIETDKYGVIPQQCTLSGYNIVYQPSRVLIANPLIRKTLQPRINVECALIQLQPDYSGIMDIVNHYAELKALLTEALAVNSVNSKLSFVFGAKDTAQAKSYQELYDRYAEGKPAVFVDKKLYNSAGELQLAFINKDVKSSYIVGDLLNDIKQLDNMFDTELGIPNSNSQKKERMLVDEINANNFETKSKVQIWLDNLDKGCSKARELYGIDLSVRWREDIEPETQPLSSPGGDTDE